MPGTKPTRVSLFCVRMVDGCYDDGGAYWGGPPSKPLYCARDREGEVQLFFRADNRRSAVTILKEKHPHLTPIRGAGKAVQ